MMLKHADPVHKVTIIPRGRAGGYTLMLPKEDRNYATKSELLDKLKVAMGGRVAEEIVLKEISTGASQDIQQATRMVRGMVMQYGMSDVLGPVAYGESQNHQVFLGRDFHQERNYSEEVASEIDKEVRKYLEDAYEACRKIITENRDKLELIAQALMERETLTAKQLEELLETGKISEEETKEPPKDDNDGPKDGDPALIPPTTLSGP
jgi:cell division protease FtsH